MLFPRVNIQNLALGSIGVDIGLRFSNPSSFKRFETYCCWERKRPSSERKRECLGRMIVFQDPWLKTPYLAVRWSRLCLRMMRKCRLCRLCTLEDRCRCGSCHRWIEKSQTNLCGNRSLAESHVDVWITCAGIVSVHIVTCANDIHDLGSLCREIWEAVTCIRLLEGCRAKMHLIHQADVDPILVRQW